VSHRYGRPTRQTPSPEARSRYIRVPILGLLLPPLWLVVALIVMAGAGVTSYAVTAPSAYTGASGATTTSSTPSISSTATVSQPSPSFQRPGGSSTGTSGYNAVSCMSASSCIEVGADSSGNGVVATSQATAISFSSAPVPSGTPTLTAVSCVSPGTCVAVGGNAVLNSTNSGSTWSLQPLPTKGLTLLGASCQNSTRCFVEGVASGSTLVGDQAVIMSSSDGGTTWSVSTMPPGVAGIAAIACPTATRCIGVGTTVIVSSDGGQTWQTASVNGGVDQLLSISCATSTQCVAVGPNPDGVSNPNAQGDAVETTDGGNTFEVVPLPKATASLFIVSCSSATVCEAGGATGIGASGPTFITSTGGISSWSDQAPPSGFSAISGIACPSAQDCVATGHTSTGPSVAASTTPGQWSEAPPSATAPAFSSSAN
jgi:photosystem II stability/assembly factor-like uncharacterized protein